MPQHESAPEATGFHGAMAGMSLSDVIQLNGNNGFSGCITVRQGTKTGRIFFREGKIVHAEQGNHSGELAFYDIMEWRSGHFSLEPNISTTSHTIQKSTQFVLMEALRLIDERRATQEVTPPEAAAPDVAAKRSNQQGVGVRLKAIPGVNYAVLTGKDGVCTEDASAEGEALAAKTAYLAVIGNQIGASLGAGDVRAIAARRSTEHFLVLVAKNHYLGVRVDGSREIGAAEAEILKLLGPAT